MARHGPGAIAASAAVLAVAGGFSLYAFGTTERGQGPSRVWRASFPSSSGLAAGAPVTVAGLPVGRVASISLDTAHFTSVVAFTLADRIALHPDASVAIGSDGPGSAALELDPGRAPGRLPENRTITQATPLIGIEQQVGDYIFGAGGLGSD